MEPITVLTFHGKNGATYRFNVYPKKFALTKVRLCIPSLLKPMKASIVFCISGRPLTWLKECQPIINGLRQHDSDSNTLLFVGE